MLEFLSRPTTIQFFGITGSLAAVLGTIIAAIPYRGRLGERYSFLNHFISELGEEGVSRLAPVFNIAMIATGLFLLPSAIGLGLLLPGLSAKLATLAGIITALAVAAVGIYPMNKLSPHMTAAMTYFRFGLVMILLYTIAIASQPGDTPALPRSLAWVGLPAILAYATFLIYSRSSFRRDTEALAPLQQARPRVWWLSVAEWAIFFTTIPWFFAISLGLM